MARRFFNILLTPFRWLVETPLHFLGGIALVLVAVVIVVPNVVEVMGQGRYLRTVDQLVADMYHLDEDLPANVDRVAQTAFGTYDCIMVLGAAVRPDGSPSPMLQERLDKGIELYRAGVAPKIVMSGDNQSDRETYNEVENMRRYAIGQGVPSSDIFCDHAGICTYDSAYRLHHVFGAKRAVLVSQQYHLYRALYDTASFGIEAVGVPADRVDYPVKLFYYVREAAARISDMYKVLTNADATYLSEPVSLNQSGDVTSWEY